MHRVHIFAVSQSVDIIGLRTFRSQFDVLAISMDSFKIPPQSLLLLDVEVHC